MAPTDQPTTTPTTMLGNDDATASVRPADARYNRTKFTTEQLQEIREQEIEDATVRLLEQRKADEEKNQEALEATGYVNPTVVPEESPMARAFDKVYGSGSSHADDTSSSGRRAAKKTAAASTSSSSQSGS